MIILISGATHTGKTKYAQKLLEEYKYPYLSIDHLKMGLIKSKITNIRVDEDEKLTNYLWPIVKEMIVTAIENNQNLIVEGCYIPFNYEKDFSKEQLESISYFCLIMSENYIVNNFDLIKKKANIIEQRLDDSDITIKYLIDENLYYLQGCMKHNLKYIYIDKEYNV